MSVHGILITFSDFDQWLPIPRSRLKHWLIGDVEQYFARKDGGRKGNFSHFFFEDIESQMPSVYEAVIKAKGQKLKILVQGHGRADKDFITNNGHSAIRNIEDLGSLLVKVLQHRGTGPLNSDQTVVVMLACLFGRSQDADWKKSNAWKLHKYLKDHGVFVELTARTEFMAPNPHGVNLAVRDPQGSTRSDFKVDIYDARDKQKKKVSYSKIICKYEGAAPVIQLVDYSGGQKQKKSEDELFARKIGWLHYALDEIHGRAADDVASNKNHELLINTLYAYTMLSEVGTGQYDPEYLYSLLSHLAGVLPGKPEPKPATQLPREWATIRPIQNDHETTSFLTGILGRYPRA